jgi:hypothetical protein
MPVSDGAPEQKRIADESKGFKFEALKPGKKPAK